MVPPALPFRLPTHAPTTRNTPFPSPPGCRCCRGPGASRLPARVTVAVLLTRLVLQPALSTGLVLAALRLRLFVSPDPMFLLILLLPNATPTAVNIQASAGRACWSRHGAGLCLSRRGASASQVTVRPCRADILCPCLGVQLSLCYLV